MNDLVENRPRVYDDIIDAVDYFFSINPKLAEDFLDRIEEAKQSILNTPKGFVVKYSKVRTILLKQFDYHIYYIFLKKTKSSSLQFFMLILVKRKLVRSKSFL